MPEPPVRVSTAINARLLAHAAEDMDIDRMQEIENLLFSLSDEVAQRFFLQSKDPERAMGMTRLA